MSRKKDLHQELAELRRRVAGALRQARKNGMKADELLASAISHKGNTRAPRQAIARIRTPQPRQHRV